MPAGWDAEQYTKTVAGPMLDEVAGDVDFVDVFCERGAFTEEQARQVLQAATHRGIATKVHGNQLGPVLESGWPLNLAAGRWTM